MRFDSIRAHAMGPFKDEIDVDLAGITGQIVAVVGENGAGKTSMLELLAGAIYRTTPTRGSLMDLATARDSFLEVKCVNGSAWTLRHTLDVVSGKSEALVLDADGSPALSETKVTRFAEWAAKTLPPENVLLASTFAAQGSGGFLEMKAAERKALLLKILGIDRLELLAAAARERARSSKGDLDVLLARLRDAMEGTGTVEDAVAAVRLSANDAAVRRSELEEASALLAGYEVKAERVRVLLSAEHDRVRQLDATRVQLEAVRSRIAYAEGCIANNRSVLARAQEIDAAVARSTEIDARRTAIYNDTARLDESVKAAVTERDTAQSSGAKITARMQSAQEREKSANQRLARRNEIAAKTTEAADLRAKVLQQEETLSMVSEQIDSLYGKRADTAESQVAKLRDALYDVGSRALEDAKSSESADDLHSALLAIGKTAHTTVAQHDEGVHQARLLPGLLQQTRDLKASTALELQRTRKALTEAESVAGLAPLLETAEKDRLAALADGQAARDDADAALEAYSAASRRVESNRRDREALTQESESLRDEHAKLAPVVQLSDRLVSAKARLDVLEPDREAAVQEAQERLAEVERLEAVAPLEVPEMPDVAGARAGVAEAQRVLAVAEAAVETAKQTLARAKEVTKRLEEMRLQTNAIEEDLADWTRLANDLGKDGLIAAEVDCVGPTLTDLVNDLLHECVGPRWTVTFETQRASSDGKKQIEGFDVQVLDTVAGRDANAETLSGGEKVIVGEAISLALSMLACQRSGLEGSTLVRDETSAALDPENARHYVGMLRRAASIVRASQVLLVSHAPEVQELCDARIEVKDGSVTVVS